MTRRQGIFWILTIPHHEFTPYPVPGTKWISGQLESGGESGYLHWQLVIALATKSSVAQVKSLFGSSCHAELTRSEAANEYVNKDDTYVEGTRFEFGVKPIRRNSRVDWESVWDAAKSGDVSAIPAQIRTTCYRYVC